MNNEDKKIDIVLDNGKKVQGNILFTFEANGDNFVLYELDKTLFAAKTDEDGNLSPIEEDEWSLVESVYEQFQQDSDEKDSEQE